MPYIGIVKRMETADMCQKVKEFVEVQQQLGYRWVHVHASTPCSSGSPLKNFSAQVESEADRSWKGIMDNVSKYLLLGIHGHLSCHETTTFGNETKRNVC